MDKIGILSFSRVTEIVNGLSMFWHENGQKKDEGNYKWGERHGLWIFYNDDGTEQVRSTYKGGEPVFD